jgi:hypothetical protein
MWARAHVGIMTSDEPVSTSTVSSIEGLCPTTNTALCLSESSFKILR